MDTVCFPEVPDFFRDRYRPDHPELQSPRSIEDYDIQIGHFCRWWTADGRPGKPTIADLHREEIASAMAWLASLGRSPHTVNKLMRVLKAMAAHGAEVLDLPPLKKTKPYKVPKRKASAWTEEQLGEMLFVAGQLLGHLGPVTLAQFARAWILTQYNTGSRISALMAVRWEKIDLTQGILCLKAEDTKDKEEQRISLKPDTVAALAALRVANLAGPFDCWPYDRPGADGRRRPWKALTLLLKKVTYCALVDTDQDVNKVTASQVRHVIGRRECTHKIRRTFATEVAAREGIEVAQELLGHASQHTTEAYIDRSRLPKHSARDILPTLQEKPPKWKLFAG